jgi:hypothetical protein
MRGPVPAGRAHQELDESGSYTATSSERGAAPQVQDTWQPVGSVLERLFQSFDFVPTAEPDDPRWKRWHARPGDLVEVCGAKGDVIGRWPVTHASPDHFKLTDCRVFAQQGWPLVNGKRSRIRARKVRS